MQTNLIRALKSCSINSTSLTKYSVLFLCRVLLSRMAPVFFNLSPEMHSLSGVVRFVQQFIEPFIHSFTRKYEKSGLEWGFVCDNDFLLDFLSVFQFIY